MDATPQRRKGINATDLGLMLLALTVIMLAVGLSTYFSLDATIIAQDPLIKDATVQVLVVMALYGVATLVIIMLGAIRNRRPRDFGVRLPSWAWMGAAILISLIFLPIRLCVVLFIALVLPVGVTTAEPTDPADPVAFDPWALVLVGGLFVSVVFLAPVIEELVFRGLLQTGLREVAGAWLAIPVSAIAFGVVHIQPMLVISNIMFGFVLAGVYHFSESLWVPITMHFVNNAVVAFLIGVALLFTL